MSDVDRADLELRPPDDDARRRLEAQRPGCGTLLAMLAVLVLSSVVAVRV